MGGPIKKDKIFFFGVYEGLRAFLGTTNTSTTLGHPCQSERMPRRSRPDNHAGGVPATRRAVGGYCAANGAISVVVSSSKSFGE